MLRHIRKHRVWNYLSATQKDLMIEGDYLIEISKEHQSRFKDYSFAVFPFAKAYEGYLKQIFLDIGLMTHQQYVSDHFRIGRYLSPHLVQRLENRSIYKQISDLASEDLAMDMWRIWKEYRNQVFHYYPHNLRRLSFTEAFDANRDILKVMEIAYDSLKPNIAQLEEDTP